MFIESARLESLADEEVDDVGSAFLVMLREGVEAALIIAILLAYLNRLDRRDVFAQVWRGTAAAALLAMSAGIALYVAIGGLEGRAEAITEAVIAIVAAGVLTWMVLWMGRQARAIKGELEAGVDAALAAGATGAIATIAFVAVAREGLESALFLISTTVGESSGLGQVIGGLLGLGMAAAIGYGFYRGSRLVDLRVFFRITGILVILFAAGLVAKGIHELQEAALIGTFNEHLWTVGFADPATSTFGQFLRSLFGWYPSPSVEMVVGYVAYLIPALAVFLPSTRRVVRTPDREAVAS